MGWYHSLALSIVSWWPMALTLGSREGRSGALIDLSRTSEQQALAQCWAVSRWDWPAACRCGLILVSPPQPVFHQSPSWQSGWGLHDVPRGHPLLSFSSGAPDHVGQK